MGGGLSKVFGPAGKACEKPIDATLAKRIMGAWESVLLETRPTTKLAWGAPDGIFEHFGLVIQGGGARGVMTGQMLHPLKPYRPGWLRQLGESMDFLCSGHEPVKAAADLEAALKAIETVN